MPRAPNPVPDQPDREKFKMANFITYALNF